MAKKTKSEEPSENTLSSLSAGDEKVFDEAFADGTAGISSEKVIEPEENASTTGEQITEGISGTQAQAPKEELGTTGTSGEDFKQQYLTLQGLFKQEKDEKESLKSKIDDLQRKQEEIERLQEGNKAEKAEAERKKKLLATALFDLYADLPENEKAELAKYDEEFDAVSKGETKKRQLFEKHLKAYIAELIESSNKTLLTNLAPFLMASEKNTEESHFTTIKSVHPDFEKYRD